MARYNKVSFRIDALEVAARLIVLGGISLAALFAYSCSKNENLNYQNAPSVEQSVENYQSRLEKDVREL